MRLVRSAWAVVMALFHFVGRVMTVVVLTVVYGVAFLPFGALLRAAGKVPLDVRPGKGGQWRARAVHHSDLEDATHPF